jgi:hypothetical protein
VQKFLARHQHEVIGVLSGLDRLLLRGMLRSLSYVEGMGKFLSAMGVLLKDFGKYVRTTTEKLKSSILSLAEQEGRPQLYLRSSTQRKEDVARGILAKQPVQTGLICVLSCVEPCSSYEIHRSRERKRLELRKVSRKCLHYYLYLMHPRFGFSHVRVQTWFPFTIHVCLNGREWLAHELEAAGIDSERRDNCFTKIADVTRAQELLDRQLDIDWTQELDRLVAKYVPGLRRILHERPRIYWCTHQTEWATDVMFRHQSQLAAIYRPLVHQAITQFGSRDVMRFLGRKVHGAFKGEIVSDFKDRPEGIRVKHSVGPNSVKVYDKQGSVLRVETTVTDPTELKALRPKAGSDTEVALQKIRRSVADLHRLATVSQGSNERYLDALANLQETTPLKQLVSPVCQRRSFHGRSLRAIRPWDGDDVRLLTAVNDGRFVLNGFSNRDIAALFFPSPSNNEAEHRRRRAKVTRLLRLLRAHRLVRKLPHRRRYQVTPGGRSVINAILAAREAPVSSLLNAG